MAPTNPSDEVNAFEMKAHDTEQAASECYLLIGMDRSMRTCVNGAGACPAEAAD